MLKPWKLALGLVVLATPARAHFPFIVPAPDLSSARVLLSETLELDPRVPASMVLAGTYEALLPDGRTVALDPSPSEEGALIDLSGESAEAMLLYGTLDLGYTQRGEGTPHRLVYHAKTLLRSPFATSARTPAAPIELTPIRAEGGFRLLLTVDGAPSPEAEIVVLLPDGSERDLMTDSEGLSEILADAGRYGAWARNWLKEPGELDGKTYEEVRRYATLVFDLGLPPRSTSARRDRGGAHDFTQAPPTIEASVALDDALPESVSSFGAVQEGGWVYVYGGHLAPTHVYHTEAVSSRFWRSDLTGTGEWEELPGGPACQGMNLAAHDGQIYRVGGMIPRNAVGEKADNWSTASAARFDPGQRLWVELPPMPEPRSSHDIAVVDGTLYVIGGWNMSGPAGNAWPTSMFALDLTDPSSSWVEHPQPFQRRALIVAVHDHKVYVLGGFDSGNEVSRRVDVFDPREGRWLKGPGLPGGGMNGFSPAACVHDRQLYVSLGDGTIHRLDDREYRWEQVGTNTPRIVHRMVSLGRRLFVLGGASRGGNLDLMETLTPLPADGGPAHAAALMRAWANGNHGARAESAAGSSARLGAPSLEEAPTQAARPPVPEPAKSKPSAAALAAAAVQSICPVMEDETVDAGSYTVEYSGRTVLLCCKACVRRWKRDPERYASSVHLPQLADLSRQPDGGVE